MGDNVDLTALQRQMEEMKADKDSLKDRMDKIDSRMDEVQEDLRKIVDAVTRGAGSSEPVTPEKNKQSSVEHQMKHEGKKPIQVTFIDDKERYSINLDDPGVLGSKPQGNMSFEGKWNEKGNTSNPQGNQKIEREGQENWWNSLNLRPKIELSMFEGENPRGWIRRCEKYFAIFNIPENHKMEIAAMHLSGRAETWFDGYMMQKYRINWHEFIADLCHRFCNKTSSDVIEEFNKLTQRTTVEEYQDKFEELKPYMLQLNSSLSENYFVSSFVSGLKEELRHKIKVHPPKDLSEAFRQARLIELSLDFEHKRQKYPTKSFTPTNSSGNNKPT
ncbi:hypothetical protein HRI_000065700 [Hibiscus trionum]|uniref:Ty3 transposon capsid-like protein domain-containing protein n=1 Tax=Hibiscus trionum TaxID=183268 RepID=A0A9W7LH91_HIBTR|nr:hypothetical protein HRI_000065700 [Hibiscus trionum]